MTDLAIQNTAMNTSQDKQQNLPENVIYKPRVNKLTDGIDKARFWTKLSAKYAKSSIGNMDAYAHTLERTASHLKQSDHMLELGCGTGTTAMRLADHVRHITATDFSEGMIDIAKQKQAEQGTSNVDFVVKSVESLPTHETYDVIFASSLLHLVPDLDEALARIHSSVEPGGLFISKTVCLKGQNPIFPIILPLMRLVGKAPFVNFFTGDELEAKMRKAGFEIIESDDHNHKPACRFIVARAV